MLTHVHTSSTLLWLASWKGEAVEDIEKEKEESPRQDAGRGVIELTLTRSVNYR
jgi:hypothetical protein